MKMFVCAALLLVFAVGCSKRDTGTDLGTIASQATSASPSVSHETANYKVWLETKGPYQPGEPGVVNVVLEAKNPYHINKQYPYKFAVNESAGGLTYPKKTVPRSDGIYTDTRAEIPVPFVAERAGEMNVGGVFSLSVCTEANCLMDKRPLEVAVSVK
ncbi:MAG: hypothetical protein MUF54_05840 [Polyangiaceae bacterium]|jgi:hypothetical protein|nr:hypothetical protein [Polyangiaceae bacterium]